MTWSSAYGGAPVEDRLLGACTSTCWSVAEAQLELFNEGEDDVVWSSVTAMTEARHGQDELALCE